MDHVQNMPKFIKKLQDIAVKNDGQAVTLTCQVKKLSIWIPRHDWGIGKSLHRQVFLTLHIEMRQAILRTWEKAMIDQQVVSHKDCRARIAPRPLPYVPES